MAILPFSSASFLIWSIGSLPGVKMSRMGVWALLSSYTSLRLKRMGVTKKRPKDFNTYRLIARVVSSGLRQRIKGIQAKWGSTDWYGSGRISKACSYFSLFKNFSQAGRSFTMCSYRVSKHWKTVNFCSSNHCASVKRSSLGLSIVSYGSKSDIIRPVRVYLRSPSSTASFLVSSFA